MKREKITLTASSMMAINLCQRMLALSLGEGYQIQQLKLNFERKGVTMLGVLGNFTAFKPEDPPSTRNLQFIFSFDMIRPNKKANWRMSSHQEALLGSNSPLGKASSISHAEFRAETPTKIVLTKPFDFE